MLLPENLDKESAPGLEAGQFLLIDCCPTKNYKINVWYFILNHQQPKIPT
jgi:hypothetical protein